MTMLNYFEKNTHKNFCYCCDGDYCRYYDDYYYDHDDYHTWKLFL